MRISLFLVRMQIELRKLDHSKGISIEVLKSFAKVHQALLWPVFELQHHLQEQVMGVAFWEKVSERRVELSNGQYVPLSDIMQIVSHLFCVLCLFLIFYFILSDH